MTVFPIRKIVSLLPLLDFISLPCAFSTIFNFYCASSISYGIGKITAAKEYPTTSTARWGLITTGVLLLITSGYLLMHSEVLTNLSYFKTIPYIKPLENTSFIDRLGLNLGIFGNASNRAFHMVVQKKYVTFNSFLFLVWALNCSW